MKKGRWQDAKVLCPYYKYQTGSRQEMMHAIYCEGVQPESTIRQTFSAPNCREYELTFCRKDYKACWICRAHFETNGEGSRDV